MVTMIPVRRLWSAVLCGYLALGATLQVLPEFVVQRFHGGPTLSGTAVGIAFLATACARPVAGLLADTGRARPVVLLGGVLGALGGLGHLLAPDYAVLLVARLLMGAGEAALFSGALPWVLSGASPQRRGRTAGWFGLSMWGGLAAGPVLATALNAAGGFTAVWIGVIGLAIGSALLVLSTPKQPPVEPVAAGPRGGLVPAGASLPGVVLGLSSYGYGTIAALLVLHLRDNHIGGESVGLALFAFGFLLTRLLGSPLVDRLGGARVAACSLVLEILALVLLAVADTAALALPATVLAGVGVALMYPATVALTLHRTGALRPGAAVGAMTSFWDLGIMAAGPLGGAIAASEGYPLAFVLAAVIGGLSLALVVTLLRAGRRVGPGAELADATT
ncbi:MFS transporter [Solihabitans fulvus]|uniref:MFS transporter n=1 Tax=Solihabitans fulvus TaxID=1892852 RepID=A0A5B2WTC7_9PSEU|nr:MFS transporter [Solihabitans fulvus]KAA2254080.1 MFS transporter [Solihabitans fulvus]